MRVDPLGRDDRRVAEPLLDVLHRNTFLENERSLLADKTAKIDAKNFIGNIIKSRKQYGKTFCKSLFYFFFRTSGKLITIGED